MSQYMLSMEYPTTTETKFKTGDPVVWEFEEGQILKGHVSKVTQEEVTVYFPDLKAEDTFYANGTYTKFEKEPSLTKELPRGNAR